MVVFILGNMLMKHRLESPMLFGPKYSLRERSHLGRFFQSLHVSSEEDCFRIQLSKCCLSPVTHQPPYLPLRRRDQQDTVHACRGLIPGAIKRYIALRWWVLVDDHRSKLWVSVVKAHSPSLWSIYPSNEGQTQSAIGWSSK